MPLLLGIDAGGTRVRLCATDAETGTVVAEAQGEATADGGPESLGALLGGLQTAEIVAVCAGITKYTREGVVARWRAALARIFPQIPVSACIVAPDYVIAFHGALPAAGAGIVVISGTGSVAYGESAAGVSVRVGGRGWEYGDEGSGSHLTTEILRRTLRALDGMEEKTPLHEAVCAFLGTDDPDLFGGAARQRAEAPANEFAGGRGFLVPLLLERAREGDVEAANLFIGAAGWLSALAWGVHRRLSFSPEQEVPIVTVGGLWEAGDLLLPVFRSLIARRMPGSLVLPPDASPVRGAARIARRVAQR